MPMSGRGKDREAMAEPLWRTGLRPGRGGGIIHLATQALPRPSGGQTRSAGPWQPAESSISLSSQRLLVFL